MRIVIDMQGAQTESRFRGIGRYTLSFVQGVVRNRGEHEVILALNGLFAETIAPIRAAFGGLLTQDHIRIWCAPGPVCEKDPGNQSRREVAELIREAFIASLKPDVIHITSLFEGYIDDAVTSIGQFDKHTPVSVSLYDLIPLLNPDHYLKPNPRYENYYKGKLSYLKQAARYLAISEFTRKEGICHLGVSESELVNVSTAIEAHFCQITVSEEKLYQLQQKFGLNQSFVLYTGGADERKNLPRLIQAYASLPLNLRKSHQLLFAGKMPEAEIIQFKQIANKAGIKDDEILFTGYLSDEELIQLYNLCVLYVFPSWHEGFGLPALEAMACGAPVIGANTSSLPEVIGLNEALFDPKDVPAIASIIQKALMDESFRDRLKLHGLERARSFSWDETAKRAIKAWESLPICKPMPYIEASLAEDRLYNSLADSVSEYAGHDFASLATCLARNQQVGIERQLLVDISELCQNDAATGVQRVVRSYLKWLLQSPPDGFRVEPVYASLEKGYHYARSYTQHFLGESVFDAHDEPMRWQRGDIFFGLDMQHHVQIENSALYQQLRQEGVTVKFLVYDLLPIQLESFFRDPNAKKLHEQLLETIAATDGAICISKATSDALVAWIDQHEVPHASTFQNTWVHIGADIEGSSPSLGLPNDAEEVLAIIRAKTTFLSVSTLEPRKGQQQVLEAIELLWARGMDVNLVFVGREGWKVEALAKRIRTHHELGRRLFWLEGVTDECLEMVYAASTCLVAASINEGFGLPLIEAARHGIPLVVRDTPIFREVAGDAAYYFKGEEAADLAGALGDWLGIYAKARHPKPDALRWSTWQQSTESLKKALIGQNYPRRQLLIDISELVRHDVKSGIQRVVRRILQEYLVNPPIEYKIEPVYATHVDGYRYARKFTCHLMGVNDSSVFDEFIDYAPGDIFLGLDLAPAVVPSQSHFYAALRSSGVKVAFVIYDLLPLNEGYYPKEHADACSRWLDEATNAEMALCISDAVASELNEWIRQHKPQISDSIIVESFHLGADIEISATTSGLPQHAHNIIKLIKAKPSFLMVSTLAPHKGQAQVIDAFEKLWLSGAEINLVIVGKEGWLVEDLVARLRKHSELNKRLFWLEGISDEYLENVYDASTCLIAASYAEGFGLPLIEAAQHKLPIIARNIPVFREVAGSYAYYFEGNEPVSIADAVETWLKLFKDGNHPTSDDMPWLTWKESAGILWEKLCNRSKKSMEVVK